jgi:hypothetical protein
VLLVDVGHGIAAIDADEGDVVLLGAVGANTATAVELVVVLLNWRGRRRRWE